MIVDNLKGGGKNGRPLRKDVSILMETCRESLELVWLISYILSYCLFVLYMFPMGKSIKFLPLHIINYKLIRGVK